MSWKQDLDQVGKDPAAGARLLLVVAEYLRRGEVLPSVLADHIAGAFEVVAAKATEEERVTMLGRELGLRRERSGRPTKGTVEDARWAEVQVAFSDETPWTKANIERELIARLKISERTAAKLVKALDTWHDERDAEHEQFIESWCAVASPEMLEVFERVGDVLDHDEAVVMVKAFHMRESASPGSD
ncbi:protein of unknown function [Thauera humireducens]|uniref:hypothetical protein n=1 Tax=Thauera humireducens TaxID=1134435 RepID=UPI002467A402|nr:hypothetical protein [Thauera humireducens]CAH1745646.1 protein of unknown function [Thauera humireducens]